jgi:hypothetical protein
VKTIIETNNTQIKSAIKTHVKHKYEAQSEQILSLSSKVKQLTDQNNALKSQVVELKKQLNDDRKRRKKANQETNTTLSSAHHKGDSRTQHPPTPTLGKTEQASTSQGSTDKEDKLLQEEHMSTNHTTHTTSSHPVANSTASSSRSGQPSNAAPANHKTTTAEERAPSQRLAECSVDQRATHLLIGDAVLDPVQPDWLFPRNLCQKLTFPNLTLADLIHWLKHIPRSQHIQSVVVHVGINTCWENTVMESQWRQLLKLLKSVFPSAKLYMSAIVLPRGQNPLWKTAQ